MRGFSRLGFIGLGNIGAPMARRLLRAGFTLRAHDLREEAVRALEPAGALPAASPAEAAEGAQVVFTSLPGPAEVEAVALGPGGLAEAMAPCTAYVDLTTSLPSTTRKVGAALGERAVEMLDAPVAGGVGRAEAGTLTLTVGGAREVFLRCKPLLEVLGEPSKVFYVGPPGMGHAAKLANNLIHHTGFIAICELLVLAAKAGLDPGCLYELVREGGPWSFSFQSKVPRILRRDFAPRSTLAICHKDVELGVRLAKELGVPLTLAPAALQIYRAGLALGLAGRDGASVVQVAEAHGRVTVRSATSEGSSAGGPNI